MIGSGRAGTHKRIDRHSSENYFVHVPLWQLPWLWKSWLRIQRRVSYIYAGQAKIQKANSESSTRTIFITWKRSGDYSPLSTHNTPCFDINKAFSIQSYTVLSKEDSGKNCFIFYRPSIDFRYLRNFCKRGECRKHEDMKSCESC